MFVRVDADSRSRRAPRFAALLAAASASLLVASSPAAAGSITDVTVKTECFSSIDPGPPGGPVRGPIGVRLTANAERKVTSEERGEPEDGGPDRYSFDWLTTFRVSERYGRKWKRLPAKTVPFDEDDQKLPSFRRSYRGKATRGKTRLTAIKGTVDMVLRRNDGAVVATSATKRFSASFRSDDDCELPIS